jgi:hypothetical protein
MNPMLRVVLYSFISLMFLINGSSEPLADTVSWPVSVAIPTGMVGDLNSKPVSVGIPIGISGELISKPVSVAIPTAIIGGIYESRPASVNVQPAKLGDPDLVGLWHMDGDWTDSSGNGNHLSAYNITFSSTAVTGSQSASFGGSNSYLEITNPASMLNIGNNSWTVSAWVNTSYAGNQPMILLARYECGWRNCSSTDGNAAAAYKFFIDGNGNAVFSVRSDTGIDIAATANYSIRDGKWHHVAGVLDRNTDLIKILIDGKERNVGTAANLGVVNDAGSPLEIGRIYREGWGSPDSYYNGLIDEVAIYKRALTTEEISQSYASSVIDQNSPAAPVLNAVPAFVGTNSVALAGTRPAGTSIWVNSKKIASSDASTTWNGTYANLQAGTNLLNITAFDETRLLQSTPVTKNVFYDNFSPIIESSSPANNSNTAKVIGNVSITLYDANAGVDATASSLGATVKNSAGQTIAGSWSTSGPRTIVFTPNVPFAAETYTVTIQATDLVGNKQQQQVIFANHDTSSPTTKVTLTGSIDSVGWYSTPVTVTLTADDTADGSGIAKVEYSQDSGTIWKTYTSPFIIEQDGKTTVQYRATDTVNNLEPVKSQEIKINKTGLVGWWKMDGNWKDSSVLGNDGTAYNGVTFTTSAKIGTNAGSFNGVNNYVGMGSNASLIMASELAISAWIYPTGPGSFPISGGIIVNKEGEYEIARFVDGTIQFAIANTGSTWNWVNTNYVAPLNSWTHFVLTYSTSNNKLYAYANGSLVYQGVGNQPLGDIDTNSNEFRIGGRQGANQYFAGFLDDVRIYNRALSATEVLEQFRNLSIGVPTVDPITSPVNTPVITLSGSKPANTSVVISNGSASAEIAPQTDTAAWAATTWQGQYTLTSGMNNLNITSKDVDGFHSQAVTLNIALDDKAPIISTSTPANSGILNAPVSTITFNLTDTFSPLDLVATIAQATVKSSSNLDVQGTWTTSGTGSTGTATFTAASPMGEGSYTATINPTDSFGNTAPASVSFTVDMTAPNAPVIDPVPSPSNTTGKTITGSKSSDSSRVVVSCPGATIGSVSYPTATTWSVPVSDLREGLNTITANSVDSAGNPSVPASASFTIDLTAPPKPTIDTPATPTNKTSITLIGGKETNTWLYVNNIKTSAPFSDTTWSTTVAINEGSNTITAFAKDEAGNQSLNAQVTVIRDTAPPAISVSTPTANAITGTVGSISITLAGGSAAPDLSASTVGAVVKNASGSVITGSWSLSDPAIVFTPTTALPEGVYTVTIYPVDVLGNKGSASFSFTVDRGPPTVQSLTINPVSPLKAGSATFTITFSENMDTAVQPQVTFGSVNYSISGTWLDGKNWRGSATLTAVMGDGTYTITVKGAKDIAGNSMVDQIAGSFLLDTTPPAAPTMAAVTPLTKTVTQLLTGTKPSDTSIVINSQVRVAVNNATNWSYSYPLAEGINTLTITARDAAGNDSPVIAPAPIITLDTTPPNFTVDIWKSPSTAATQLISGKKEPGCVVKMNNAMIFDASEQNADWSYTINLVDGISNHFVFTATDAIGNVATKTLDILYDSVPPTPLGTGILVADGSGKGTEASLTWPSYPEPTALAYYRVFQASADFTTVSTMTSIGTVSKGTKTFKVSGLTQGTRYWFAVVPVSSSGNSDPGVNTASTIPSDTLPPEEITGLLAVAGYSSADSNTVSLFWTASANSTNDLNDQILYVDDGKGYDAGSSVGKSVVTFIKKGLADATLYKFKVTTKDTLNHESAGTIAQAVTRLVNPTGLTAIPGNAKATLSWSPVVSPYVKFYNIYRIKSDSTQNDVVGMPLIKSQTTTSFTDSGLDNGATYQYAVTVINTSGAERTGVQSVAVISRGDTTGPVISGLNLTANQVLTAPFTISASAADAESAMDRFELSIDGTKVATAQGSSLSWSWNVIDVVDGNHTIKVAAFDAPGNKTENSIQVVVSLAAPPVPVITTTFGGAITQKTVAISGTTQPGATVFIRLNGVGLIQLVSPTANFTFTGIALSEGDNYIAVKAANRGGESNYSTDLKITVDTGAPPPPVALSAKVLAGGSLQFTWQLGTGEVPTGFNLYESNTSFTAASDSGVRKTNSAPIAYLLKEQIPVDDTTRFYAVSALDGGGNESPISNVISAASDRSAPTATVAFTGATGTAPSDNTYGPGSLSIALTVSEPLKEMPFLSLEPQSGSPIVVALQKTDDTHYTASLNIDATSPQGTTTWKFSGKDLVGNRGNNQGTGPTLDVRGPQATITAPLTLLKSTAGPVAVSITLDEASTITPVMSVTASDSSSASISGLTSTDNIHWSGTLDPSALAEGNARFVLSDSRDRFNNRGIAVISGTNIIIYKTNPPAPSIPMGLTAKSFKGGEVHLAWMPVTDARSYNIYRQGSSDATPVKVATVNGSSTTTYIETVTPDGSYAYSITSVGLLDAESAQSAPVSVVTDATSPPVPAWLVVTLTGNGVKAIWQAGTGETAPFYRLYRSSSPIDAIAGLTPVATVNQPTGFDPSPDQTKRFYAVTSVDAIGNESAPSSAPEITFPVMPVRNLILTCVDDGKPALSWEAGETSVTGYYIYRNGSKVNQVPTLSTTFSDGNYAGSSVTYSVSALNSLGTESPAREATLPEISIGLKEGTVLRRGVLENIILTAAQPAGAASPLIMDSVALKIGSLPESIEKGPFTVQPNTATEVTKVAATESNAPPQVAVVTTAIISPVPGVTIKITRSSLAGVIASGSPLEVFNEPMVRGTQAQIRIKFANTGSARSEFVSSENGGPSSQVRVLLKDQDGNILAQGRLNQRAGSQIVDSGSYATVRLEPGESFLSDLIAFAVPANAPYKVILEAAIDNTWYHYKQDDQVMAPGMHASLDGTIADVSYMARAVTDKSVFKQGESILITGTATSTSDAKPMANVPVKIGISVKGFDRSATVNTDNTGNFSYTFTPGSNEAGSYSVWAIHPDLSDRTVQAQFSIIGLQISPLQANIRLLKGQSYDIPVTLTNLGGSALNALAFVTNASNGITATVPNPGNTILNAGENRTVTFRVGADQNAPASGFASLDISTTEGLGNRVDASITTISAIPVIATSPSYIDTGLMRGNQRIENLTIRNTGAETLINPRIEGPSLPWLVLTVDKNIGDIPAGQSRTVGILIKPADTMAQGVYDDRIVIYSDNHIPYTFNIQVTVTSSAVGNVEFSVLNELMKDVAGATISIQHQSLPELYYTLKTATDGTASKFDIPEGRYTYNISAPGHKPYSGSFVIIPGITAVVPIALEVTLVTVEWSVTPVIIEDRYQITVSQTFETNVPTAVIVTEPPAIMLPKMDPGQVFNGEFTITNYGLVSADYSSFNFPTSFEDYDLEVLAKIPPTIGANQKIVVPYRITRRNQTTAALIAEELIGYGDGSCSGSRTITVTFTQIICPYALNERTVTRTATYTISWNTCPIPPGGLGGGGTPPVPTYGGTGSGTGSGMSGGGAVPSGSGTSTPLPDTEESCIYPCRPGPPDGCN